MYYSSAFRLFVGGFRLSGHVIKGAERSLIWRLVNYSTDFRWCILELCTSKLLPAVTSRVATLTTATTSIT